MLKVMSQVLSSRAILMILHLLKNGLSSLAATLIREISLMNSLLTSLKIILPWLFQEWSINGWSKTLEISQLRFTKSMTKRLVSFHSSQMVHQALSLRRIHSSLLSENSQMLQSQHRAWLLDRMKKTKLLLSSLQLLQFQWNQVELKSRHLSGFLSSSMDKWLIFMLLEKVNAHLISLHL